MDSIKQTANWIITELYHSSKLENPNRIQAEKIEKYYKHKNGFWYCFSSGFY